MKTTITTWILAASFFTIVLLGAADADAKGKSKKNFSRRAANVTRARSNFGGATKQLARKANKNLSQNLARKVQPLPAVKKYPTILKPTLKKFPTILKPTLPGKIVRPGFPGKFPPVVKPFPPIVKPKPFPPSVRPFPLPPIVRPRPPICLPRPDWCHKRPRYSFWWYDACRAIRHCRPAQCVPYVATYVTCNYRQPDGVIVAARWRLGITATQLPSVGLGIDTVEKGSPAELAGLKPGMIITHCNDLEIADSAAMGRAISDSNGVLNMTILVEKDAEPTNVSVQMLRLVSKSF